MRSTSAPTLTAFLEKKPLYYKEIDHQRVHAAYDLLKLHIDRPKTVHIVGTNGKGSTGRMIAHLAYEGADLSVGHYSSPHILKFNERIWIDGADASDAVLEKAHQFLFKILGQEVSEGLSYFEYTTLLAFVVFEQCDLMVLEAGLGGEFDATNVCDKELSVITPIGVDHQAFLGNTIRDIAYTKINSIQKRVLLAPQPYWETVVIAREVSCAKEAELHVVDPGQEADERRHIAEEFIPTKIIEIAKKKDWGVYLSENAAVALLALDILNIDYDVNDLWSLELFGRFYLLAENIRIDVGHNPLAAKAIVDAMEPETVLIYNSLEDKDYEEVLRLLKPKVKRVEIIAIEAQRATPVEEIEKALQNVGLDYCDFENHIEADEHYLVFGSFYVVEAFLRARTKQ